jgi:hypothetical protein
VKRCDTEVAFPPGLFRTRESRAAVRVHDGRTIGPKRNVCLTRS